MSERLSYSGLQDWQQRLRVGRRALNGELARLQQIGSGGDKSRVGVVVRLCVLRECDDADRISFFAWLVALFEDSDHVAEFWDFPGVGDPWAWRVFWRC